MNYLFVNCYDVKENSLCCTTLLGIDSLAMITVLISPCEPASISFKYVYVFNAPFTISFCFELQMKKKRVTRLFVELSRSIVYW